VFAILILDTFLDMLIGTLTHFQIFYYLLLCYDLMCIRNIQYMYYIFMQNFKETFFFNFPNIFIYDKKQLTYTFLITGDQKKLQNMKLYFL